MAADQNAAAGRQVVSVEQTESSEHCHYSVDPNDVSPKPLYFSSGTQQLFGWLFRPSNGTPAETGLLICKPFGYEAICSHRSVRTIAETAAGLGIPAFLFDYVGTGDSADIDPAADQVEAWTQDVIAAAGELQRRTGVARVHVLGLRLGALLATQAAIRCKAIAGLILVAPIVSGKRYLRDLRTTRLAAGLTGEPPAASGSGQPGQGSGMEISGFFLSSATLASLAAIDLTTNAILPVSRALIVDSLILPTARAWSNALIAAGAQIDYQAQPGMVEMLMTDPQFAVVAQPMLSAVKAWLQRDGQGDSVGRDQSGSARPRVASLPICALRLPKDESGSRAEMWERPVFLNSETTLFGIVTEPHQQEQRRRGIILLNVGAEHHIGSSRMYVSFARNWAQQGYTVLRMDLAGLGDSGTRIGRPSTEVFPPAAIDDIQIAVDFMRSRYAIGDLTLAGLCSGAYHSLRAAIAGVPVNRVFLVNPMNFLWDESLTADNLQLSVDVARNVDFYRSRMLSAGIWKRIMTGDLHFWRIIRILMHRPFLNLRSRLHDVARDLKIRLPGDLGWELQEVRGRGIKMVFVFARGEPGLDVLKLQAGSAIKRLGAQCAIHVIDGADHIFSHGASRQILERTLNKELLSKIG